MISAEERAIECSKGLFPKLMQITTRVMTAENAPTDADAKEVAKELVTRLTAAITAAEGAERTACAQLGIVLNRELTAKAANARERGNTRDLDLWSAQSVGARTMIAAIRARGAQ